MGRIERTAKVSDSNLTGFFEFSVHNNIYSLGIP